VTPRFIPTCSDALLTGLGALHAKYKGAGCWVQSHMAESLDEMAFVESLHPGRRDAAIFDQAGLLTDRCVMAHAVHLTGGELALVAARKTGIACCPLSNIFFANGEFPLRQSQRAGARVGLGTDVAGGYSPSMLSACR
jgi:guanine deaminase